MNRLSYISLIISIFLLPDAVNAQKRWSLEECISYALQNNIQLKREVLQSKKVQLDRTSAFLSFTPTLGAQFNHSVQIGRFFSQLSGQFETNPQEGTGGIGGRLDLSQGLTKWNALAQSKFDLLSALQGVEELKRNLALNIAAKYLEVLYANERYSLAKERVKVSQNQVEGSKSKYELGKISNADYLQISSQAIAEKVELTNAQNSLDLAKLELAQMLELKEVDGFEILSENIQIPNDTLDIDFNQFYGEALDNTPSVKMAEYGLKSSQKGYLIALGTLFPTVSLNYQINSYYSDQFAPKYIDQAKDNVQKYVTLQVNIPIYGKLQNQMRLSKARIDKMDAQFALEQTEKSLLKSVQQAILDAKGEFSRYQSMLQSEASYKEVYELNKEKFELGMVNAVDYGFARNNYIKAQGDLLHAKYSYLFKLKILDFYRGTPISL